MSNCLLTLTGALDLPTMCASAGVSQDDDRAALGRPRWSLRGYPGGVTLSAQDGARPSLRAGAERVALHETGWDTPPFFPCPRHASPPGTSPRLSSPARGR